MPSNTTSSVFFYTYVLEGKKDGKQYIGYTSNLRRRLEEHRKGLSFSTKFRLPFKLIYFEGCLNQEDAKRRENYLKTTQGRRFLGLRLSAHKRQQKAFGTGSWYTGYATSETTTTLKTRSVKRALWKKRQYSKRKIFPSFPTRSLLNTLEQGQRQVSIKENGRKNTEGEIPRFLRPRDFRKRNSEGD